MAKNNYQNAPVRVNTTLRDLDREEHVVPFRFGYRKNKIIEFPYPQDLPFEKAVIMAEAEENASAAKIKEALIAWIGEEDARLLFKELSAREMGTLWGKVSAYYQSVMGSPGK